MLVRIEKRGVSYAKSHHDAYVNRIAEVHSAKVKARLLPKVLSANRAIVVHLQQLCEAVGGVRKHFTTPARRTAG